jgi:hypothetical protein
MEQTKAVLRERNVDILQGAVVAVLFSLAVLNEFVTTNPGVPLAQPRPGDMLLALLIGLVVAGVAHFLDSRGGMLRFHSTKSPTLLVPLAVAAGVGFGLVILAQMVVIAQFDEDMRQRYVRFFAEPLLHPVHRSFSAAVIEEVLFRYIGMTAVALYVARRLAKPQHAYRVALISTAAIFGLVHLPAFSIVGVVIVLFNMLAGLLYGWMFWHLGLIYPMLAHFAAGSFRGIIISSFGTTLFA